MPNGADPARTFPALGQPPLPRPPQPAQAPAQVAAQTAVRSAAPAAAPLPRPERVGRVRLARIDPWSVLGVTLVFSVLLALVCVGAVMLLYVTADRLGAVSAVNDLYHSMIKPYTGPGQPPAGPVTAPVVAAAAGAVGVVGVVALTTLTTVAAMVYNVTARITKGVQSTLVELG